jgi:D-glycero-D-manno-heptose 1,7-bisphosphate phosphatase
MVDRDGVLNEEILREDKTFGSPRSLPELKLNMDNLLELNSLISLGIVVVVISNQPDISANKLRYEDLLKMHQELFEKCRFDAILWCPHLGIESCSCRKPKPSMLNWAKDRYGGSNKRNIYVGDRITDMEAARNSNSIGIHLIQNSHLCADLTHYHAKSIADIKNIYWEESAIQI